MNCKIESNTCKPCNLVINTYGDVVKHYLKNTKSDACLNFKRFSSLSLSEAISKACKSLNSKGGIHSHQRRVANKLPIIEKILLSKSNQIKLVNSFDELYNLVKKSIVGAGVFKKGPLTIYDISTRIGSYLGLYPNKVYLHRGALKGAQYLNMVSIKGRTIVPVADFPKAFHKLKAHQIEDCLCIYKSVLKDIKI